MLIKSWLSWSNYSRISLHPQRQNAQRRWKLPNKPLRRFRMRSKLKRRKKITKLLKPKTKTNRRLIKNQTRSMSKLTKRSRMRLTKKRKRIYKIPKWLTFAPLKMSIIISSKRSQAKFKQISRVRLKSSKNKFRSL